MALQCGHPRLHLRGRTRWDGPPGHRASEERCRPTQTTGRGWRVRVPGCRAVPGRDRETRKRGVGGTLTLCPPPALHHRGSRHERGTGRGRALAEALCCGKDPHTSRSPSKTPVAGPPELTCSPGQPARPRPLLRAPLPSFWGRILPGPLHRAIRAKKSAVIPRRASRGLCGDAAPSPAPRSQRRLRWLPDGHESPELPRICFCS